MREEFDQYHVDHPNLESFLPYDFGASKHAAEAEPVNRGDVSQSPSSYVSDYVCDCLPLTFSYFFVAMASDKEKDRYRQMLAKDKGKGQ